MGNTIREKYEANPYEKFRILVLEDETYIRKIICRLLRQIGFDNIAEAADGTEGFEALLRVQPHIILCDIHMAPMDGMTFLRQLRSLEHPKLCRIPLIFLTADQEKDTVLAARDLRVSGYLAKPVSPQALKSRLDPLLLTED